MSEVQNPVHPLLAPLASLHLYRVCAGKPTMAINRVFG